MRFTRGVWSAGVLTILGVLRATGQSAPDAIDLLVHADEPLFAAQTARIAGEHTGDFALMGVPIHRVVTFTYEQAGGKVRVEQREDRVLSLELFDGADSWGYRSLTNSYSKVSGRRLNLDDTGLRYLVYGRDRANIVSAGLAREEQVTLAGAPVRCYVVTASYRGSPGSPAGVPFNRTVWIAADRGLVLRDNWVAEYTFNGRPMKTDNTFRYSGIEWDIRLPEERFRFEPPPGSQAEGAAPTLEVVSIHPHDLPLPPIERFGIGSQLRSGDRMRWIVSVRGQLLQAYHLMNTMVPELPEWAGSEFYDVELKVNGNPTAEVILQARQQLLEQKFQLKTHFESQQVPLYELSVAAGGFKGPKPGNCMPSTPNMPYFPTAPGSIPNCGKILPMYVPPESRLQGGSVTMTDLAKSLGDTLDRPVRDKTGITAKFDVYLPIQSPRVDVPQLTKTLEEKFGLKLELTTGPADVLVVDKLERPFGRGDAPVTLPPSHISIAGGVAEGRKMLNVAADGSSANLEIGDDRSGRQRWTFQPGRNAGWYNILVSGGVASDRKYLSAAAGGPNIELSATDDGSGRQRWVLENANQGLFRIAVTGGIVNGRKYLSVTSDGHKVDLYGVDDGSGRQRWKVDVVGSGGCQDFSGTWRTEADLSAMKVNQEGCKFTGEFTSVDGSFRHTIAGQAEGDSGSAVIARTDAGGCTTTMNASLSWSANRDLMLKITGTAGKCGLSQGYTETRIWKR